MKAKDNIVYLWASTGLLMCPIFMLAVGLEAIYGGWISSFAVLHNYADKQNATMFSSLFWVSITVFRFILVHAKGTNTMKLLILFGIGLVASFMSLVTMERVSAMAGLYGSAIAYGLSCSILYAVGLALPQDSGIVLADGQSSNFIMSSAFGEGALAVVAGQLMAMWGPDAMFYFLGLLCLAGILNVLVVVNRLKQQAIHDA